MKLKVKKILTVLIIALISVSLDVQKQIPPIPAATLRNLTHQSIKTMIF